MCQTTPQEPSHFSANFVGHETIRVRVVLKLHTLVLVMGLVGKHGIELLNGTSASSVGEDKLVLLLLVHHGTKLSKYGGQLCVFLHRWIRAQRCKRTALHTGGTHMSLDHTVGSRLVGVGALSTRTAIPPRAASPRAEYASARRREAGAPLPRASKVGAATRQSNWGTCGSRPLRVNAAIPRQLARFRAVLSTAFTLVVPLLPIYKPALRGGTGQHRERSARRWGFPLAATLLRGALWVGWMGLPLTRPARAKLRKAPWAVFGPRGVLGGRAYHHMSMQASYNEHKRITHE